MEPVLQQYFKQVESMEGVFIDRLRSAVAIKSVSSEAKHRQEVVDMANFLENQLTTLGAQVEKRTPGDGLPPVLLGRYGNDSNKRSILVYGHYDVQPASLADGWDSDPFILRIDEGRMFGRGTTDDKGPVLGWVNAIEAHKKAEIDFPVNLLMCFEGMEESGSTGLDDIIKKEAKEFFKEAAAVCISDNYWLGSQKPCLTYGLRGVSCFEIEISGPSQDLHSGVYGGTVTEPMTDLIKVMSTLVDNKGKILIPGIYEDVAPVTLAERALYTDLAFTMQDLYDGIGSKTTIFKDTERTLMARWRYPCLSLHGIQGAFSDSGTKTVIPAKVTGKFSIRTVPNMDLDRVEELVRVHVLKAFANLESNNSFHFVQTVAAKWWVSNPAHWNFNAAAKAVKEVWGVNPDMTREGGSIPVTLTFEQQIGKNVLLLPMGSSTDGAHSTNEKLDQKNYIEGTKLLGAYLHFVAQEPMTK